MSGCAAGFGSANAEPRPVLARLKSRLGMGLIGLASECTMALVEHFFARINGHLEGLQDERPS